MASDFSFSSGTTPVRDEGIWFLWVKILMRTQTTLGGAANPDNDPRRDDTLRTLRVKVDKALNGL